ncbi:MAG: 6-bladed beta-propeller [Mangrovibacterium sp.]
MKRIIILLLFLNLLFLSCTTNREEKTSAPKHINLKEAFTNKKPIKASNIINTITYVRLESKKECMIGENTRIYATKNYLIGVGFRQLLLFDRETGKFIREIGKYGKGPGNYSSTDQVLPLNEERNTIYALSYGERKEYSLEGKLISSAKLPPLVFTSAEIDEKNSIGFIPNFSGNEKDKLVIFTAEGSIIQKFPNYLSASPPEGIIIWKPHGWFYKWNKQLYFYELFNDTLFHVTSTKLIPRFVFDMGKYQPPYEKQTSVKFSEQESEDYFIMKDIYESSGYLFYTFSVNKKSHIAIYDKKQKETLVNDYSGDLNTGLENDIDNFISLGLSSINNRDELIGFADAYKIVQWFQENPEKAAILPANLQRLKNMKETDNPVVMIAKLKEE